ncbi:KPN_02809 family neutral zinc metallopeptidase [Schaalia vaccimaxillae]|uniref:KPN_02809 family neutral zinc metallopeptidase n=1 Tax=Schaalia vaccimaxillae TaxID=183916 RepID=UPI0003B784E6|nr:neutral zinc metallopeptidase [Schaalia vaccimaxillae]
MSFNEGVRSDTSRVRTSSGRKAAGIGGGSVLLVVAVFLIGQFTGVDLTPILGGVSSSQQVESVPGIDLSDCGTAEAANSRTECRMVMTADSLDAVWKNQLAEQNTSVTYKMPSFQIFQDAVSTGCGNATSYSGPFYCPADSSVYLDLGFFEQLETQFGAVNAPLAQEYVVAHEWGHHIQNLQGILSTYNTRETGEQGAGVRSELQADCYAGVWMHWASRTKDPDSGVTFLQEPTESQIADALAAAEAIGDDRIQEKYQGSSNSETWTHGSSEQRQTWLLKGLKSGSIQTCDTWSAQTV